MTLAQDVRSLEYFKFVRAGSNEADYSFHELSLRCEPLETQYGGIVGGMSLAVVGDLVPDARRASAVGTVMSAFSVAQVAGVPLGLYFADKVGWHVPFLLLAALSGIIWIFAILRLPKVRAHLQTSRGESPLRRFLGILANANHMRALALMSVITFGGFMIIPDLANYLISNVQLNSGELRWVYLIGGSATLFTMNGVGRHRFVVGFWNSAGSGANRSRNRDPGVDDW